MAASSISPTRRVPWGLVWTALAIFLAALDQTVVITVLPEVASSLNLSVDQALQQGIWVITGYLLGYTVALPLLGRVADVYGHRRLFFISLLIFAAGSIGCAMSGQITTLVAWRIVQAIGGGAVLPIGLAIAMEEVAERNRATALGVIGAAGEAGGVLGPAYGGLISRIRIGDIPGWHWVFWLNLPLIALLMVGLYRTLPRRAGVGGRVDYIGGGLLGLSLTALTVALARSLGSLAVDPALAQAGVDQFAVDWTSPQTLALLGVTVGAFIGFIWWERRTPQPLINLSAFKIPAFSAANLTNLLVGMALIVGMVNIPFLVGTVLLRDALAGGLMLIRMTAMIPIGAVLGGLLMRRISGRTVAALGMIITALGYGLLGFWPADVGEIRATVDLVLTGLGFGLVIPPLSAAAIGAVDRGSMGTAAGLLNALRMVGITLGVSALASWSLTRRISLLATIDFTQATADGTLAAQLANAELQVYHSTFFAAAAICLLALVPILWLPRERAAVDAPLIA
ncbi:MAG: MFS transporter [Herpetosiphonaceae bacterium]|nr:MFS transporter [Herpetosiphonaceae bacterium]